MLFFKLNFKIYGSILSRLFIVILLFLFQFQCKDFFTNNHSDLATKSRRGKCIRRLCQDSEGKCLVITKYMVIPYIQTISNSSLSDEEEASQLDAGFIGFCLQIKDYCINKCLHDPNTENITD